MDDSELRLGYLVFGVRSMPAWTDFCTRMLGLPPPSRNDDGSVGWRLDDAAQRLVVTEDGADDLVAFGIEAASDWALDAAIGRLRAAGHEVGAADPALARARRVRRVHVTRDPAGNAVELFAAPEAAPEPFRSDAFPRGFVTGALGMGHLALAHDDLEAMEDFYGAMGFAATERLHTKVGPLEIRGTFLHCNRRHHSLALFRLPSSKRVHHFMLQAQDHMDVGRAYERARALGVPPSLTLGQHPDPDGTFSFYAATPSGFDFEIGAGSRLIEPSGWAAERTTATSSWGHQPTWRLKLRLLRALLSRRRAPALRAG